MYLNFFVTVITVNSSFVKPGHEMYLNYDFPNKDDVAAAS